jgi:diketogulonate reductase-like aldo/keto reductase
VVTERRDMELNIKTVVELNHGGPMPLFGLGTFRSPRGAATRNAVGHALELGYRMIDTAAAYENEADVGAGIRESGVARGEVFVTTKLRHEDHGFERAVRAFDESVERLGLDYVDLFLIHWPGGGRRLETWRALERLVDDGRTRAIGLSNYMTSHLGEMLDRCDVVPAVNQIELHPFNYRSREDVVRLCRERRIVVEGYSPLTKTERMGDRALEAIAAAHGKTAAQVLIRWALQHGVVTIPKSTNPDRIRENADVFDFHLSDAEMARLDALDEDFITSWDPRDVE